jgi:hypothetical protein
MQNNDTRIQNLVDAFWGHRNAAVALQLESGVQGGAARSGGHMRAIQDHVRKIFLDNGLSQDCILPGSPSLPGFFRRAKSWDIVVVYKGVLVAAIELKSQVGSVGNNANNRIEEAIGNAFDIDAVQRNNQAFGAVPPWLGFVMVFEESERTQAQLRPQTSEFSIDPIFENLSYSRQYQIALSRFVSDGLYDAGWFLTTKSSDGGKTYTYDQPLATATESTFEGLIRARIEYVKKAVI